jgi:hypothetical protein
MAGADLEKRGSGYGATLAYTALETNHLDFRKTNHITDRKFTIKIPF